MEKEPKLGSYRQFLFSFSLRASASRSERHWLRTTCPWGAALTDRAAVPGKRSVGFAGAAQLKGVLGVACLFWPLARGDAAASVISCDVLRNNLRKARATWSFPPYSVCQTKLGVLRVCAELAGVVTLRLVCFCAACLTLNFSRVRVATGREC